MIKYYFLTTSLLLLYGTANAIEVVRATIINGNTQIVDIVLYDNNAPVTVNNFTNNIDTNVYKNLFFNRSIENFIVQTGGYSFDPSLGDFSYAGNDVFNGGLHPTQNNITIQNEFKLSNLRGTLAMAKPSNSVDNSSNQWFINLSDNSFLDTSSEGFTVFGEILDSGMGVIDQISKVPTYNLSTDIDYKAAFTDVPLNNITDATNTSDINNTNLIKISLSRLFNISDRIDFSDAIPGSPVQKSIVVSNTGGNSLTIGSFDSGTITPPFSIINDACSLQTLLAFEQCSIVIEFNPLRPDFFESTGSITIQTYKHNFPVLLKTPSPDIELSKDNIDFAFQPVYNPAQGLPKQAVVRIRNTGDRDLSLSSVNFSSSTMDEFELIDNCTTNNNAYQPGKIQPDSFCILVINFRPKDILAKAAIITIISDDPNEAVVSINIAGNNTDNDGIDSAIEDAAPNNGDGNFDGGPDRLQNNVASFANSNGIYTTLITNIDTLFTKVKTVALSSIEALPDRVRLDNEAFSFELSGFPAGSVAEFGLILPAGHSPANIYNFGSTVDNNIPHWYSLEKNSTPGVITFGDVAYGTSGARRNISSIRILDGGDGDADMKVNGTIVFVGGPEINNQSTSSSGSMLWLLLISPALIIIFRTRHY